MLVDVYYTGGSHYTQVHITGQQPTTRCEVYPEGTWSRVGQLRGMEDVLIGSPAFDRRYVIQGESPAALRNLLSPGVRRQIERLRSFLGNGDIYVSFNRRELLVKKQSFIRDYHRLREFVELATALYDQSVLTAREGIEFIGSTGLHEPAVPTGAGGIEFTGDVPLPDVKEVICQICGETITSDMVFCRRCRTPHHQDCWKYYRACSTYGCRETKYLHPESRRAKLARRKIERPAPKPSARAQKKPERADSRRAKRARRKRERARRKLERARRRAQKRRRRQRRETQHE